MISAIEQEISFGEFPKAPGIARPKLSSITAQVLKTLEKYTYYCDSVEYKRKDKPAAWRKYTNKPSETMFKSYPDFEFIPGTKGDELPIMYGDFWIDIDTKEEAVNDAKKIIAYFQERYGVDNDEWQIFLSGKKGVHLGLSERVFGIELGHTCLMSGYKRLAHDIQGDLGVKLDLSLYQKGTGKPFRQPNILRPDTQTYKVQIEFDSENEETPGLSNITDDYVQICSKPRAVWTPEAKYNDTLSKLLQEYLDEAGKETKAIPIDATQAKLLSEDFPPCLRFMASNTEMSPKNATFNDVAIQLTSSFISAGKTEVEFLELCQGFISGYPTTSLKEDSDRLINAKNRFRNALSNDYQHSCGGILSLGFSSKDFKCDDCFIKKPKVESENKKPIKIINVAEFLALDIPPRENILSPWLPTSGIGMIYAFRGVGKTHFSLNVAYTVASGGDFLCWKADKPRSVLFIDGEMAQKDIQDRLKQISASSENKIQAIFNIYTPELQEKGTIDLSTIEDQEAIEPYLFGIDLIIVDNISTLCKTGKENERESWIPVQDWALKQRKAGKTVLFIHHAGKSGGQRGTSGREDVLNTVILLKNPDDYRKTEGVRVNVVYEKSRGFYGDDAQSMEASLTVNEDGTQTWDWKFTEESFVQPVKEQVQLVADYLNLGHTQTQITDILGASKGAVSKWKQEADKLGLINKPIIESIFKNSEPRKLGNPGNSEPLETEETLWEAE